MDYDTSANAIVCSHFPDIDIAYCGNHTAKSFYYDLCKIKALKCKCKAQAKSCKLFTTTPLASVLSLSTLTVKSVGCMMSIYHDKVRKKKETDRLLGELKSEGTASLAKRLYAAGLTYSKINIRI